MGDNEVCLDCGNDFSVCRCVSTETKIEEGNHRRAEARRDRLQSERINGLQTQLAEARGKLAAIDAAGAAQHARLDALIEALGPEQPLPEVSAETLAALFHPDEEVVCHEECAHLPAIPQCIYRLSANDTVWLCRDLDKAKAHAARWKKLARNQRQYIRDEMDRIFAAILAKLEEKKP